MMTTENETSNNTNNKVWLRIIQINDVYELENFPHFKTLVESNSSEDPGPDKVLVVLSGDFLGPSLLSSLDKGRGMVDCMNQCGISHVCFGNHETDVPMKDLRQRIMVDSKFHWINTNMRQLDEKLDVQTLPHEVIEVTNTATGITKRVGLLGLLTDDPSVYRTGVFAGAKIESVIDATERYMKDVMEPLHLDLIVPLTHQRIYDDREFMKKFKSSFPLIIGGHDHEVYDVTVEGSRVVKTGMDGENTAIHDIVWNVDDDDDDKNGTVNPVVNVKMMPTKTYPADGHMINTVECHERILQELHRAKIFRFRDWLTNPNEVFTTKDNRLGLDNGTEIFATMLRMGMRAKCGLMNAGNVRGGKTYPADQEWFTWSDLKAEIPFTVGMTAVDLPGKVLEDTINESRTKARMDPPVASGGYIQTCDKIVFDEEQQKLISICGESFDPTKLYFTAIPTNWFEGMDDHVPLLEWASGTPYQHAKESSSKPSKEVVVELFSALLWLEMGSFEELDTDGDGYLSKDEVRKRATVIFGDDVADLVVDNVFSVADCDGDGMITPVDMMIVKFVAEDMHNHHASEEEIEALQKVAAETLGKRSSDSEVRKTMKILKELLDKDNDGKITRKEAMNAVGEVRRRSLLM